MSKRGVIEIENAAYFYTARLNNRLMLFGSERYRNYVIESLRWLRNNGHIRLHAFVIIPNHVHFLFSKRDSYSASKTCHSFSSCTAHRILKELKQTGQDAIVEDLRTDPTIVTDRCTAIWENTLVLTVTAHDALTNIVEYIHNNPVQKYWDLCDTRSDYLYSSAMFYDCRKEPVIPIDPLPLWA